MWPDASPYVRCHLAGQQYFQLERDMGRLAAFLKRKESEGSKLIHL
jgi:hypothetical protein